jgi:hypothetical protein
MDWLGGSEGSNPGPPRVGSRGKFNLHLGRRKARSPGVWEADAGVEILRRSLLDRNRSGRQVGAGWRDGATLLNWRTAFPARASRRRSLQMQEEPKSTARNHLANSARWRRVGCATGVGKTQDPPANWRMRHPGRTGRTQEDRSRAWRDRPLQGRSSRLVG